MYNRYVPQPDGTYRRNRIPEPKPPEKPSKPPPPPEPPPCDPPEIPVCPPEPPKRKQYRVQKQPQRIQGFLNQLLPRDMDTGDLMVILLLLLIAGDCEENRSHALLTLALYFFL